MSGDGLRDEIAATLTEHEWRTTSIWDDGTCACGWVPTDIEPSHREHQINVVTSTVQVRIDAAEQALQRVRALLVEDAWHYDDEIARALDGAP